MPVKVELQEVRELSSSGKISAAETLEDFRLRVLSWNGDRACRARRNCAVNAVSSNHSRFGKANGSKQSINSGPVGWWNTNLRSCERTTDEDST
jgi:hypothetical protein